MDEEEKIRKLKEKVTEIQVDEESMGFFCALCKKKRAIKDTTAFKYGFCCDDCLHHLIHITFEPGGYIWWN